MAVILVIDDDEYIRKYLFLILQHAGHTVLEAGNGRIGLEKIASNMVDLIITDIIMPEIDGIDLLSAILKIRPKLKVIAMSGGFQTLYAKSILEMALTFGAIDTFTKPIQIGTLIKKVEQALRPTEIKEEAVI